MTIPVPLAVRLSTTRGDRHVTAGLRDLQFRSTAPGGFASARLQFDRPLSLQPDEVAYYGRCYVYDTRNGNTVWEGRIEDPGRSNSNSGQVWEVIALGPAAHTKDRVVPLIYVDRSLQRWTPSLNNAAGVKTMVADNPGGSHLENDMVLQLQFQGGQPIVQNSQACMRYWPLYYAGQKLARYDFSWDAGIATANYELQVVTRTDAGGSLEVSRAHAFATVGGGSLPKVVVTDFANGRNTIDVRAIRVSAVATTVTDDVTWAVVIDPIVVAMRYLANGTEKTSGYTTSTVLSSDVVADLLGRLLTMYDGANASIATTSYAIEQLAYPDGIDANRVLADLMQLDPNYYWAAWESNSAGKYRFEWSQWPTTVRYECDAVDGFDSPGSADGLYDAVRVRWRTVSGEVRTNRRTQTVPALSDAGFSREALIDLADDVGTSANANQAGDQYLAQHATPPNGGRLRIARPIMDLAQGCMVQPWEIRPGALIRVRGVQPRVDALNASDRDGVTVFRIASTEYSVSSASADLELDSYASSTSRLLAGKPSAARRR